jgi:hypothetical protein
MLVLTFAGLFFVAIISQLLLQEILKPLPYLRLLSRQATSTSSLESIQRLRIAETGSKSMVNDELGIVKGAKRASGQVV